MINSIELKVAAVFNMYIQVKYEKDPFEKFSWIFFQNSGNLYSFFINDDQIASNYAVSIFICKFAYSTSD